MKLTLALTACAAALLALPVTAMPELKGNEQLWLLTEQQQLIKVAAAAPATILQQQSISGLAEGEKLLGIDYRVAYGVLFGLSDRGQLYQIDTASGQLTQVGSALASGTLSAAQYGFDFNPAADRIRVVNANGQNLRLHPETGVLAFTDPELHYAPTDVNAANKPAVVAAAYTYNQQNEKLTTNYAIDLAQLSLVTQGSVEGVEPAVSPNTGTLFTVGKLALPAVQHISFDISDLRNIGLISATAADGSSTIYQVDLQTAELKALGSLNTTIMGLAIEP